MLFRSALEAGGTALAQLVFGAPVCAVAGDRVIVRNAQATQTVGGGMVLDNVAPERHRRAPARLAWLQAVERYLDDGRLGPLLDHAPHGASEARLVQLTGLPASARLGISAMILATLIGMSLGAVAALRQNSHVDHAVMAVAMTGIAVPNYVVAPLLTLAFGIYLSLLPIAGWNGGALRNMILPVTVLALPQIAYIARLTRGSMVEVLRANYVRTARAKGLAERVVVVRHALKAAALPVVTYLGPASAGILTGSVVVESIFDLPGMGRYFVNGALNRDYTLVMGAVIVYASLLIALNLVVDLLYAALDPKVRYD